MQHAIDIDSTTEVMQDGSSAQAPGRNSGVSTARAILKPGSVWSIDPADTVLAAARIMEEKNIGFLVVLKSL